MSRMRDGLKGDSASEESFNEKSEAKIYEHVHSLIFHSQQGCSHLDGKDYHQGCLLWGGKFSEENLREKKR